MLRPSLFDRVLNAEIRVEALERCKSIAAEAISGGSIELPSFTLALAELVSFFQVNSKGDLDEIKARVYLLLQNEMEAISAADKCTKCPPESLVGMARIFCFGEERARADELYLEALTEAPLDDDLMCEYASFLLHHSEQHNRDKAKELFERASTDGKSEKAMIALICFSLEEDSLEEIDKRFDTFLETTNSWKLQGIKSLFERQMEEPENAEEMLQKSIQGCDDTYLGELAEDLLSLGFPRIAQKWFSAIEGNNETNTILDIILSAKIQRHLNLLEEAADTIKSAFRSGPAVKEAWLEAALIYDAQNMPEAYKTFESYLTHIETDALPDPHALYRICTLALKEGNSMECLEFAMIRSESVFFRLRAEAFLLLRQENQALECLSTAARKNPRDAKVWELVSQTETDPLKKKRAEIFAKKLKK